MGIRREATRRSSQPQIWCGSSVGRARSRKTPVPMVRFHPLTTNIVTQVQRRSHEPSWVAPRRRFESFSHNNIAGCGRWLSAQSHKLRSQVRVLLPQPNADVPVDAYIIYACSGKFKTLVRIQPSVREC